MTDKSPDPSPDPSLHDSSRPLDGMLCFSVYAASLAFNRLYKPLLEPFGLTYLQYLVLVVLREKGDLTVGGLGERLFLESNTLTPLLKRTEAMGLITRRRDERDERVVRIALTEGGRQMAQDIACVPPQVLEATGMTREALLDLAGMLNRLGGDLRAEARR